jgi:hypothetical protein
MAVPTSGALSMLDIAQEALYGTWGSGTITGPISMYDMINGGNSHGSGNSYPTVNDDCTPNPVDRSYYQITLTEATYPSTPNVTVYTTRNPITDLTTNDVLYDYVNGSYTAWTGASQTNSYWIWSQGTFFNNCTDCPNITVNSSGVITSAGCSCP